VRDAAPGSLLARYHVWVKLAACLILFTTWVQWWFVPRWLVPHYRGLLADLNDLTGGTRLPILFELLPRRTSPRDLVIYFVGDSSVGGAYPPQDFPPWMLREQLQQQFPDRRVVMVNCTTAGLYAQDALVVIAKALATGPDLVIYAMSPRIVPMAPELRWATSAGDLEFDWDVVSTIGVATAIEQVGLIDLPRTMIHSWWKPVRLRAELLHAALEAGRAALPPRFGSVASTLEAPPPPHAGRWMQSPYFWPRADYRIEAPSQSMAALAALIDVCARERRCLLYHVPTNPAADRGFEPGLLDEFAAWVSTHAAAAGVPFADYRGVGLPAHFKTNLAGLPDGLHPNKQGYEAFVPLLTARVTAELRARGR
jgi:lysophospholipase L1-like esterase